MKKIFGLLGYPLEHSFSPDYFRKKFLREGIFDAEYQLFSLDQVNKIGALKQHNNIKGFNVTIPYKELILDFLDDLDKEAETVGAVNTVVCRQGHWRGFNTDIFGFEQMLLPLLQACDNPHPRALILGSGGASKAVFHVCRKKLIPTTLVSRSLGRGLLYEDMDEDLMHSVDFIINTTPLGMYPNVHDFPPIPYHMIKKTHFLIDLVYNPKNTVFLTKGLQHGATVKNGLDMLVFQAEKSWEIWNQN